MQKSGDQQIDKFGELCCQLEVGSGSTADVGNRAKKLDEEILKVGPWWIANFMVISKSETAKQKLGLYLERFWPQEAASVQQMIDATHWRRQKSGFENDFGAD